MSKETKSAGELHREAVESALVDEYPKRLNRAYLRQLLPADWTDSHLDNALNVLKKRAVIFRDAEGYQLHTAPDWYTRKLMEERNAEAEQDNPEPDAGRSGAESPDAVTGDSKVVGIDPAKPGSEQTVSAVVAFTESDQVKNVTVTEPLLSDAEAEALTEALAEKPSSSELNHAAVLAQVDELVTGTQRALLVEQKHLQGAVHNAEFKAQVLNRFGQMLSDDLRQVFNEIIDDLKANAA